MGNGVCISYWNCSFDINLLEAGLIGGRRRILATGEKISEALFDRAEKRLAEIRSLPAKAAEISDERTGGTVQGDLISVKNKSTRYVALSLADKSITVAEGRTARQAAAKADKTGVPYSLMWVPEPGKKYFFISTKDKK